MGFDAKKVVVGLGTIVALATGFVVALGSNWYLCLREDGIAWHAFWSVGEKRYAYSEVSKLVETTHLHAPNGNIVERKRFQVIFADGLVWCNEDMAADKWWSAADQAFVEFLQGQTGKTVIHAQFIEDVP